MPQSTYQQLVRATILEHSQHPHSIQLTIGTVHTTVHTTVQCSMQGSNNTVVYDNRRTNLGCCLELFAADRHTDGEGSSYINTLVTQQHHHTCLPMCLLSYVAKARIYTIQWYQSYTYTHTKAYTSCSVSTLEMAG